MTIVAAIIATALLAVVALFQLALAAGAPWGAASWGGRNRGKLPVHLRIASAVAGIVVYPVMIAVVLAASGLIEDAWLPGDGPALMWILSFVLGVGALANFVSRSPVERYWGPVALAIAVCCALIAMSR